MSDFWARKVRTYFHKIDVNDDGIMSKNDVEGMADNLADVENLSPERRALIKNHFIKLWRKYKLSAGSDDNGLLTPSIIVASLDQQRNDPDFREIYVNLCRDYFGILDVNGDGYLSEEEYKRALAGILIKDVSFVRTAFENLDVNSDGKLSIDEYANGMVDYLLAEDYKHLLWGPLVA